MSELFEKATKICLFKRLLFTMENATAADSSQSNISRIYIWKDNKIDRNYNIFPFFVKKKPQKQTILKYLIIFAETQIHKFKMTQKHLHINSYNYLTKKKILIIWKSKQGFVTAKRTKKNQ